MKNSHERIYCLTVFRFTFMNISYLKYEYIGLESCLTNGTFGYTLSKIPKMIHSVFRNTQTQTQGFAELGSGLRGNQWHKEQ